MEGKGKDDERNEFFWRFNIYEPVKVLWFGYMKQTVYNRDVLIWNALFDFIKPMKRLEYWSDVKMCGSASNGTCKFILNMLKAFNLSDK